MEYDTAGRWVPRYELGFSFFISGIGRGRVFYIDMDAKEYLCTISGPKVSYDAYLPEMYLEEAHQAEEASYAARESTAVLPLPPAGDGRCPSCGAAVGGVGGSVLGERGADRAGGSAGVGSDDGVSPQQTAESTGRGSRSWSGASPGLWLSRLFGVMMIGSGAAVVLWCLRLPVVAPSGAWVLWLLGALGASVGGLGFVLVMEKPSGKTAVSARHKRR